MRVVLLGATKGMGRSLARRLAARGDRLALLGRQAAELELAARDLEARGAAAGSISYGVCDLEAPETFGAALDSAIAALGGIDAVVVTAALFAPQAELERDAALRRRLLEVNFVRTIEFCEAARERLLAQGGGTICVFGSVAGDRGRTPVVLYGATKAGLSAYLEGLDHRFYAQGLRVVTVKPGFVRTSMTAGLPEPPFAGEPDAVAARVVRALDRATPVVYAPPIWALVMFVVRHLPRAILRRVGF